MPYLRHILLRKATTIGRHAQNGQVIFHARRRLGLSQTALGNSAGITYRQVIRLENGEHLPSAPVRDRLAAALGLERAAIQSGDDDDEESDLPPDLDIALRVLARYVGTRS